MRTRLAAAGLAAAGLVGGGVVVLGSGSTEAAPAPHPTCAALRVTASGDAGVSTAYRVDLGTGAATRLRTLDRRVDAIGHHRGQGLVYGLAKGRLVTLTAAGALVDRGPVDGPDRLRGASAGAVLGDLLVVRDGRHLRSVAIDPGDRRFGSVVRSVRLWPAELARTVDDFDVRGGALYGVTTHVPYYGRVVRIDPTSGNVSHVDGSRLPGGRSYGSAGFGPDGALFAASNRTAEHDWHQHGTPLRSRLIRVELSPNAVPEEIAAWPVTTHSDMTGCLGAPPRPTPTPTPTTSAPTTIPTPRPTPTTRPPTTTRPPSTPAPTAPATTTQTTTSPARPGPTTTASPAVPPPPPLAPPPQDALPGDPAPPRIDPPPGNPPRPGPTGAGFARQSQRPPTAAQASLTPTQEKRRWGIATLVMIMGAAAAAGAARRHRR